MPSQFGLEDSVVVVTGAGSGIGRATATRLAGLGATVVAADINNNSAAETAGLIADLGHKVRAVQVDIADPGSVERLHASVLDVEGRCDVLVNNAGWQEIGRFIETDRAFWERIAAINCLAPPGDANVSHRND